MGNIVQANNQMDLQKHYTIIPNHNKQLTFLEQKQTGNEYCLKSFTFGSIQGLQACVQKMNIKKRLNHQHLLKIKDVYSKSENNFCSNIHKVFVVIEYPFKNLSDQIQERKKSSQHFQQNQIWSILYSCSMALNYLYSTNLTHGCLTSDKIYIDNSGLIKLSDPSLLNQTSNIFSFVTQSHNDSVYISPQQILRLPSGNQDGLNKEVSDVFTLGMILIQALTLQSLRNIYHDGINFKELNKIIDSIGIQYSYKLKCVIERMLQKNVSKRISFEQIQNIVQNNINEENSDINNQSFQKRSQIESKKQPLKTIQSQNSSRLKTQQFKIKTNSKNNTQINQFFSSKYNFKTQQQQFQTFCPPSFLTNIYTQPNNTILPAPPKMQSISYSKILTTDFPPISNTLYYSPSYSSTKFIQSHQLPQLNFTNRVLTQSSNNNTYQSPSYNNNFSQYYSSTQNFHDKKILQNIIPTPHKQLISKTQLNINKKFTKTPLVNNNEKNKYETSNLSLLSQSKKQIIQRRQIPSSLPNSIIVQVTETQGTGAHYSSQYSKNNPQLKYVNEQSENGSHYEGYKLNGLKHGYGKLFYQDGVYYEGEWKHDKMDGFAKLYYQSGDVAYQGYWTQDKLHGKGKVFNDNQIELNTPFDFRDFTSLEDYWQYYDGQFEFDAKQGYGTIKLTNGQIFQGCFDKDIIHGQGKFLTLSGEIINGIWQDNKLIEIN